MTLGGCEHFLMTTEYLPDVCDAERLEGVAGPLAGGERSPDGSKFARGRWTLKSREVALQPRGSDAGELAGSQMVTMASGSAC